VDRTVGDCLHGLGVDLGLVNRSFADFRRILWPLTGNERKDADNVYLCFFTGILVLNC
jgi:hypothetical protein